MTGSIATRINLLFTCLTVAVAATGASVTFDTGVAQLEKELRRQAKASGGEMGVTAIHLESGRRASLNGSARFPMASAYKIPIAIQLLTLVDEGKEQLDRLVKLQAKDIHPEGGPLTEQFNKP